MTISFNDVPSSFRVPFVFVEFDNSRAQQGPSIQEYKALIIGNKLAGGTATAEEIVQVTSSSQARKLFGAGSIVERMASKFLEGNKVTELNVMPVDDDGAGVAAGGEILFGGTSIKAGTLSVMIGGLRFRVGVDEGDTPAEVASALVAEINGEDLRSVDAAVDGTVPEQVNLTARNKGETGNEIRIIVSPFEGEELPENLTAAVTAMSGGSGNPDVSTAIAALDETQYHIIMAPWTDSANLTSFETELEDRFGPIRANDGHLITAEAGTLSDLSTLGNSRNSKQTTIMDAQTMNLAWEMAAAVGAQVSLNGQADPARPFQTLVLDGILPLKKENRRTLTERNTLLFDGVSTIRVDAGGLVRMDRVITTFKTNAFGAPDTSYLDLNTKLTLSFLRFDFRATFSSKYPRHKLADDGTRFGAGQAIMTPKVGRAEAIAKFRQWETLGLVEGADQFKNDLIVERNIQDPNRLDFLLPPDLINQLRVTGVQIQFLL